MNLSVLIADDEELIRKGIIARLEFLNIIINEVYEAENGLKALEIMASHKVDIVITDIRMNDMDGIELIGHALLLYPKVQFIILSGYAEFAYAEQAIQLGVKAYLLKPISNDNLKKAMNDVLLKLEEDKNLQKTIADGFRSAKEKKLLEFEKNVNDLLRGGELVSDRRKLYENVELAFPIKKKWVLLGILNIDGESYDQRQIDYKDIELIHFSIKNIFNELTCASDKIIVNNLANLNQLYFILACEKGSPLRKEAEQIFSKIQSIMWNKMNVSVTAGISTVKAALTNDMTKEAQEAFLQRMIHGNSNIYFYDDIKLLSTGQFPASELNILRQSIERQDVGNIEFLINDIFSEEKIKKYNVLYIRIVWLRIVNLLLKTVHTSFNNDPANVEKLILKFDMLDSLKSLEELRGYFFNQILECLQFLGDGDTNSKNKIRLAAKYIEDNYNQDIAVNDLAEKYNMSPNYFSAIFKKEIGQSAVNYITAIRMKKACKGLKDSGKSVIDISKEVGYEDSQYFFRVFKKATGQTPLQYRKANK